jgi:uncharacterized protein YciI
VLIAVCLVAGGASRATAQTPPAPSAPGCDLDALSAGGFDPELARKLSADPNGMRRYVLAFLLAGPNRNQSDEEAARLQKAHLANIARLGEEGKLVLAGPFLEDGQLRGIYVFAVESVEEARKLTETDPAIQAGRLRMELHPWYGSAALGLVNALHKRVTASRD